MKIAIDVMGGDNFPSINIDAVFDYIEDLDIGSMRKALKISNVKDPSNLKSFIKNLKFSLGLLYLLLFK